MGCILRRASGRQSRPDVDRETVHRIRPVAGYIVARETAGELHINNVAVRAEYRSLGIGAALLNYVLDEARRRKANAAFLGSEPQITPPRRSMKRAWF